MGRTTDRLKEEDIPGASGDLRGDKAKDVLLGVSLELNLMYSLGFSFRWRDREQGERPQGQH
jgi:hypothetical protein